MLAYAAHRRAQRRLSPSTLAMIIGGHALAVGLLITAKMTVDAGPIHGPTRIYEVPLDKPYEPPPPNQPRDNKQQPVKIDEFVDRTPPVVPIPNPDEGFDAGPPINSTQLDIGKIIDTPLPQPPQVDVTPAPPVKIAARQITPADLIRPPYPDSKRRLEQEAVLRLRLSIDERGRVTAVEPVGAADPAFLASARTHLIRNWRYKPATEDGHPVPSSLTITLRFQLERA